MLTTGQPLTANQQATLVALQPYLTRIAHNIVRTHYPEQDADELLQTMNEAICERAAQDPTFLDQTPGYITRAAAWAARNYCQRERFGHNLVPQSLDAETGDDHTLAETIPAPLADLDLPLDVARALARLSRKRQQIVAMLAQGFQRKEIAERFGVKSPSLTWDLNKIKTVLQPVYAAVRR